MRELSVEVLIILLLVLVNGVFAMAEIAVLAARRSRLEQRAAAGDRGARVALELLRTPSRFISTVQVGITLVGVLAGAFGGATLARPLAAWLATIPALAPYAQATALGLVVLPITVLSLVLGELVPKRVALAAPEGLAAALAPAMRSLAVVAAPVVHVLSAFTELVVRALRVPPVSEPPVTEEEVRLLIARGAETGVFKPGEQKLVERVFRLADRRVSAIMTPRTEITWLDVDDPPEEIRRKVTSSRYSAYPVAEGTLDRVVGIVQARDLLVHLMGGRPIDLRALAQRPLFIPETAPALSALDQFRQARTHTALLIDEYGGLQGLVTSDDILEAIVGEIPQAGEAAMPSVVRRADGSWLVDGMLPADEFKMLLGLDALPAEGEGYETVGGMVMTVLDRIPSPGDHVALPGWRVEVVDMDGHRVDKVLAAPMQPPPGAQPAGDAGPEPTTPAGSGAADADA
ncbi:MAG: hemolysin family protein [Armatimonadota bacterium]|nr:hemolysin family protein [Armatimonadota bacterium]MDR7486693.1 hemolysin family protein [Armatimonadota bacterium]MDR7533739.1 hemolysin family protein [Armatimonadota bacterium]MDR7535054.1 hemolysin family protein [Armatimonadota bacterium]